MRDDNRKQGGNADAILGSKPGRDRAESDSLGRCSHWRSSDISIASLQLSGKPSGRGFHSRRGPAQRRKLPAWTRSITLASLACLAGCAVGPKYERPTAPTPAAFKEAAGWKPATPNDAADHGPWWEAFRDPLLNDLVKQVDVSNQSLLQAAANYEQARYLARADRATLFPSFSASGSAQRAKSGSGRALAITSNS